MLTLSVCDRLLDCRSQTSGGGARPGTVEGGRCGEVQVKGEAMDSGVDVLLTSPHLPTLLQLRDAVSASWQYSASQLQDCKSRLQESYNGIQELNADLDQKEALIEERQQDLETLKQELVRMSSILDTVEDTCLQEVTKHEADRSKLQRRLQERRQDWSVMKSSDPSTASDYNKTTARMVEKLLADLDKCALQLDLKNEVLKGLAGYVATPPSTS
jgi:chromosome segregation ATPase